jgi:hypothetical protein
MTHTGTMSAVIVCSARGCRRDATWQLRWRNPKLHTEDRRKIWTACDEHRTTLADFLTARGFLRDIVPVEPSGAAAPSSSAVGTDAPTDPAAP